MKLSLYYFILLNFILLFSPLTVSSQPETIVEYGFTEEASLALTYSLVESSVSFSFVGSNSSIIEERLTNFSFGIDWNQVEEEYINKTAPSFALSGITFISLKESTVFVSESIYHCRELIYTEFDKILNTEFEYTILYSNYEALPLSTKKFDLKTLTDIYELKVLSISSNNLQKITINLIILFPVIVSFISILIGIIVIYRRKIGLFYRIYSKQK